MRNSIRTRGKTLCRDYAEVPTPACILHQWDCPNLLWELMRTRRVKLNAQQLVSRNVSEAIVDKDNHARDAMKYHLMSHPEPSRKTLDRRVSERLAALQREDPTMAVVLYNKIVQEEKLEEMGEPEYIGMNLRRRIQYAMRRRRQGRW